VRLGLIKEIFRKREILGAIYVRAFGLRFCAGGKRNAFPPNSLMRAGIYKIQNPY